VLAKPHPRYRLGAPLALRQNQLPQRAAHVTLRCFHVIAALDPLADLFYRNPRDLLKRFLRELKRSVHNLGEMLVAGLSHSHDACSSTPLAYARQECCTLGDTLANA
jgi:hypothetical protein